MTDLKDATLEEIKAELIERYRRTGDERISIWGWPDEPDSESSVEIDLIPSLHMDEDQDEEEDATK